MPLYDYRCSRGHVFEGFSTIAARHHRLCSCGVPAELVILHAPRVFGDLPGYQSPIDGRWVEGRRARNEDLKRSGCRPYEGFESESKQMARTQKENEDKLDHQIDVAVEQTLTDLTL